jgi:hypothetical protein
MSYQPWTRAGQGYRSMYSPRLAMPLSTSESTSPATAHAQQRLAFWQQESTERHATSYYDGTERGWGAYMYLSQD